MRAKALVLKDTTDIDWQHFEALLHELFNVNAVALAADGTRMTTGDIRWANRLCALIKANAYSAEKICDRLLSILIHAVKAKKALAVDECAAGMNKIVVPIIRNDAISGFVNICGRPFSNADRIYTGYIQETTGADAEDVRELLPTLSPISPRTFKEMKNFITSYVH